MSKGSNTRSGLLWEVERLLNETEELPQVLVMENVPQVHSKKNMPDFQNWLDYLESRGYKTYWQDLNAMNFGVAQSRNRCIAVSILGDSEFEFPQPIPLERLMKDYLEDEVDERYYLTSDKAKELIDKLILNGKITVGGGKNAIIAYNLASSDTSRTPDGKTATVSPTLLSRDYKGLSNYGSGAVLECSRIGIYRERDGKTPE